MKKLLIVEDDIGIRESLEDYFKSHDYLVCATADKRTAQDALKKHGFTLVLLDLRLPDGDGSRAFLPPDVRGESAAFMMLNRGKRGLALDLRAEEGRSLVRRLVVSADVIIENFRAGTMERMGLGYDQLSALNPRLVYCQITGYGRTGPLSSQGGFDLIAQGYAGLMSVTGEGPGRAPVKVGMPVTDISAGTLAAFGVVSALFERERTGEGQRVDTSLFEAGISQRQLHRQQGIPQIPIPFAFLRSQERHVFIQGRQVGGVGHRRHGQLHRTAQIHE